MKTMIKLILGVMLLSMLALPAYAQDPTEAPTEENAAENTDADALVPTAESMGATGADDVPQAAPLSPEEVALLDRVGAAILALDTVQSYIDRADKLEMLNLELRNGDEVLQSNEQKTVAAELTAIQRAQTEADYNAFFSRAETVDEDGEVYTRQGELRFVDGTLFANAAYLAGGDPGAFPDDWLPITDPQNAGAFEFLDPETFMQNVMANQTQPGLALEMFTEVANVADSVATQSILLEDGAPAEQVIVTVLANGIAQVYQNMNEPSPQNDLILAAIGDTSRLIYTITLDANGTLLSADIFTNILGEDVDFSSLGAPEGATGFFSLQSLERHNISALNAPLESVARPVPPPVPPTATPVPNNPTSTPPQAPQVNEPETTPEPTEEGPADGGSN